MSILKTFDNKAQKRDYEINISCPEFTSLCPATGQPDFAEIKITYIPDKKCIELKSLKLYINSFRNIGEFHEHVTNKILDDIGKLNINPGYSAIGRLKALAEIRGLELGIVNSIKNEA